MSAENIPVTPDEETYFKEMERARAGLAAVAGDAERDGSADYVRRPEHWTNRSASGRTWNVAFQPGSWRHGDAFLTLRQYMNNCPDNTQVWVENNTLYFLVGDRA